MASPEKRLKFKNIPAISIFVIFNAAIYIVILSGGEAGFDNIQIKFTELKKEGGLLLALMPVIIPVLSNLLSSNIKHILVFMRVKHVLPGHRVFSKYAPNDPRINMNLLKSKLGELPSDPIGQNSTWYKLYKTVDAMPTISSSHREFLLLRDLASIAFVLLFACPLGLYFNIGFNQSVAIYTCLLVFQFIIVDIAAHNVGKRFTCNVIAEYLNR